MNPELVKSIKQLIDETEDMGDALAYADDLAKEHNVPVEDVRNAIMEEYQDD